MVAKAMQQITGRSGFGLLVGEKGATASLTCMSEQLIVVRCVWGPELVYESTAEAPSRMRCSSAPLHREPCQPSQAPGHISRGQNPQGPMQCSGLLHIVLHACAA